MTPEFLNSTLEHLYERTKEGKQHWNVEMKTSEYKEESEKPVVEADGINLDSHFVTADE